MKQAHMAQVTYVCDVVGCDESRRVNETYGLPFRWLRITTEPRTADERERHFCERHAHDVREVITFGKRTA